MYDGAMCFSYFLYKFMANKGTKIWKSSGKYAVELSILGLKPSISIDNQMNNRIPTNLAIGSPSSGKYLIEIIHISRFEPFLVKIVVEEVVVNIFMQNRV